MKKNITEEYAIKEIKKTAALCELNIEAGKLRRSSSRFCLGVEHGDYNGTELFGTGTNRYIWCAYKKNNTGKTRAFSLNMPDDKIIELTPGETPPIESLKNSWGRFLAGAEYVLRKKGYKTTQGFDAVFYGNIPGGGMSRSASLCLNVLHTLLELNGIKKTESFALVDMAREIENDYIGSPCGELDQVMIAFARENYGLHYNPEGRKIQYIPLGKKASQMRLVSLDTGTKRPGLEKSTYKIRRDQCEEALRLLCEKMKIYSLSQIKSERDLMTAEQILLPVRPELFRRVRYIFFAQMRFSHMLQAWKKGDMQKLGALFRADGLGLRDDYEISGRELETMCDIARTVPGVFGERMLGGGDKGSAGAIIRKSAFSALQKAVEKAYPQSHPEYADEFNVIELKTTDGITDKPLK